MHPGELHPEVPHHLQPPAQRHPEVTPLHRQLMKLGQQLMKLPQTLQQTQHCTKASMVLKRIPRRNTQQEKAEKGAFQDLTSINGKCYESDPGYHKPFQWGFTVKISGRIQRGMRAA